MDFAGWSGVMCTDRYRSICFLMALAYQLLLWIGLVRLHIDLKREDIYWEECIGKIRSAYIRKLGGEEELDTLKKHKYAPIVDKLITLNFYEVKSSVVERYLLLRWKIHDELHLYLIRWLRLLFAFLVAVWFISGSIVSNDKLWLGEHQTILLWVWLLYALRLAQKQITIWRGLEQVQRSLLLPHRD